MPQKNLFYSQVSYSTISDLIRVGLALTFPSFCPSMNRGTLNSREDINEPHDGNENTQIPKDEALLSKSQKSKDLNYTSPQDPSKLSTSLFTRMKNLLAGTIGETTLACEFFGIHKDLSEKMLKYDIYQNDGEIFEELAYRALLFTVMATKRKRILNLPG